MQLNMCCSFAEKMLAPIVCLIILFGGLATATPVITLPLNSQIPPVARVSVPFSFTLSGSTFSSDEVLTYSLSGAPSWLSLDSATRTLFGTPPDSAADTAPTFDIVATDGSGSVPMRSSLVVSSDMAPEVAIPIEKQLQSLGVHSAPSTLLFHPLSRFKFSFEKGTFTHNGTSSGLGIYATTMDNTALPSWMSFDNSTMTFSGATPDSSLLAQPQERFGIRLIASDILGFAGASIPFYIVVENHILAWDDTVVEIKAIAGEPFESDALYGTLKLDGSIANKVDIVSVITIDAPTWLYFNDSTYALYGTPQEPREDTSSLDVAVSARDIYGGTATVIVRIAFSKDAAVNKDHSSLDTTVGQQPSAVRNSAVETEVSTPGSKSSEPTLVPTTGNLKHGLSSREIAAAATLSVLAILLITVIVLSRCGGLNCLQSSSRSPAPSKDISKPPMRKAISLISLNWSPRRVHRGFKSQVTIETYNTEDSLRTRQVDENARQSARYSKYSDGLVSYPDSGYFGQSLKQPSENHICDPEKPCHSFDGMEESRDSTVDNSNITLNSTNSSDGGHKSHDVITYPSAVRDKGSAYSYHPYRKTSRASNLQLFPEVSCTTSSQNFRVHKRHRTLHRLSRFKFVPNRQHHSIGHGHPDYVLPDRSTDRTVRRRSKTSPVYGHNHTLSARDNSWGLVLNSPKKTNPARPPSTISAITESTDVLYLDQQCSTPTVERGRRPTTFLDVTYSPSSTGRNNSSSSLIVRPLSRRTAGSSPFFSGSGRSISPRVRISAPKEPEGFTFYDDDEGITQKSGAVDVPQLSIFEELVGENSTVLPPDDPGRGEEAKGLESNRSDNDAAEAYTGSIKMTEDGTRRLISFLAAVDKRRSWVSDSDLRSLSTRQSFSTWNLEYDNDSASRLSGEGLHRFKNRKSNASIRSKSTYMRQSNWFVDESQDAGDTTVVEQTIATENYGGLPEGDVESGNEKTQNREHPGRVPTPVSPVSFELGIWGKREGIDDSMSNIV